ncbi:MFS transporter [Paraburkholderia sacchari]|uniref:MFS transporter n=1 Tax=Paraburkholderia sacchari TaxID=159450 RepID=UPI000541B36B|nr:MFS transporter [Paraburkholderia sacchari]NLP63197.1 MFS transporter [Paraburkholderia sacchari]
MKSIDRMKWLKFVVLVMGGGTVYKLANLKDAFYVPMQQYLGLTNAQIGVLLSVNSLFATALFVVGGYLSDRFQARRTISLGMVGAGVIGIYLSTFPGYNQLLVLFAALAVCSDCLFWPALLKAIRNLGNSDEQGRMFGFLEGGRGVIDTLVAFSALGLFVVMGSGPGGFKAAILMYSVIDILVGVLTFFLLSGADKHSPAERDASQVSGLAALKMAIRLPKLWLVSLNVFMVYVVYCGLTYFIPYLKYVYGLPVGLVGAYGIINQYGLKIVGGPLGGYLSDKKFGSAISYIRAAFFALIPMMAVILCLPGKPEYMIAGMIATLGFSLIVFTMRGVFWAPMEEAGIPNEISGAAFGVACLIGYAPGMFAFMIYGAMLDAYPGVTGYHYVFGSMTAMALIGIGVANVLARVTRTGRAPSPATAV